MEQKRYTEILQAICGFGVMKRQSHNEDHKWMKQGNLL